MLGMLLRVHIHSACMYATGVQCPATSTIGSARAVQREYTYIHTVYLYWTVCAVVDTCMVCMDTWILWC